MHTFEETILEDVGRGRVLRFEGSVQFEKQEKQSWEPCILIYKIVVKFMAVVLILLRK